MRQMLQHRDFTHLLGELHLTFVAAIHDLAGDLHSRDTVMSKLNFAPVAWPNTSI